MRKQTTKIERVRITGVDTERQTAETWCDKRGFVIVRNTFRRTSMTTVDFNRFVIIAEREIGNDETP